MDKKDIRQTYRNLRLDLSAEQIVQVSRRAVQHLVQHPLFNQSEHIACYLAYHNEVDTQPLIEAIWKANKICYLPVLTEAKTLAFVQYSQGDVLTPNQYHILEPDNGKRTFQPESLDLVILPLIAFDTTGSRLGTGGGYYDRTFAFLHGQPEKRPAMIGLAYAIQEVESLPTDPWDVKLDGVVTENGFIPIL